MENRNIVREPNKIRCQFSERSYTTGKPSAKFTDRKREGSIILTDKTENNMTLNRTESLNYHESEVISDV